MLAEYFSPPYCRGKAKINQGEHYGQDSRWPDSRDYRRRAGAIAPGLIGPETIRQELSEKNVAPVHGRQIIRRWGEEADIVGTMLYLVSPEAGFVTGETLRISGGSALYV